MKTMRAYWVPVALLSAAMCPAMASRAEKPASPKQQEPDQQEKHAMNMVLTLDDAAAEGQESRQNITLQLIATDAQVVKGKPYSADTSTETVQTLGDGNRIVHRTVSKVYRDTDGRTRREQTFGNVDPEHPTPHELKVFVDDPVAGSAFVLDPSSKSGDVQRKRKMVSDGNGEEDGTRILLKSGSYSEGTEQSDSGRMLIKFRDEHSGNPSDLVMLMPDEKRNIVKEDLGTRNIEGVECTGTRTTITIPAGAVGNEKPIAIVTETWFASAINAVVQSTTDDPRYGKTTYQLTNVQLSEPARSLFEPPADFKINGLK